VNGLEPGEAGWDRDEEGRLVWVRVNPDGSRTVGTPPPLTPPEEGKPIFGGDHDWPGRAEGAPHPR
jgi:hypothetical protein